jgi:hypothetical protein
MYFRSPSLPETQPEGLLPLASPAQRARLRAAARFPRTFDVRVTKDHAFEITGVNPGQGAIWFATTPTLADTRCIRVDVDP